MPTVIVIVAPIVTRSGYYTARCNGRLLCRSRQPLLDGARELLASGYPADTIIVMRHAGSAVEALRSTIGAAARLTVETSEHFRHWRGPRTRGAGPSIAPREGAATPYGWRRRNDYARADRYLDCPGRNGHRGLQPAT